MRLVIYIYISGNTCSMEKRLFDFSSNARIYIFLMGPDQKPSIVSLMLVVDIFNEYTVDDPLITVLQKKRTETLIYCVKVFKVDGVVAVQITIRWVTDLSSRVMTIVGGNAVVLVSTV